jgi:hypothetical protein
MTPQEAIEELKNLRLFMELEDKMNKTDFNSFTYDCVDTGIKTLENAEKLKTEMKSMKEKAMNCENWDYATGYISAISTLEGYLAILENGGCENGEINV